MAAKLDYHWHLRQVMAHGPQARQDHRRRLVAGDVAGQTLADPIGTITRLVAGVEPALATGLIQDIAASVVHFRHPLVRSGVLQLETVTRRYAANAALAELLASQPYRRTWHRAQSITGPDDEVAGELEESARIALRRGSPAGAIWALERAAQLTTDSARRGQLVSRAASTSLSQLEPRATGRRPHRSRQLRPPRARMDPVR